MFENDKFISIVTQLMDMTLTDYIEMYGPLKEEQAKYVYVKVAQAIQHCHKNGIIHGSVGKVGFDAEKLKQNVEALISDLKRLKPSTSKGIYVKRVTLSTTMGPGLIIDQGSLDA